jgi:hypothetical protein
VVPLVDMMVQMSSALGGTGSAGAALPLAIRSAKEMTV